MVYLVYLLIKNLSTYSLPVCMGRGSWSYFTQSALFIIFIRQDPSPAQPGNDKAVSSCSDWFYEGGGGEEVSGGFGQNGRNSVLTYSLGNAVSDSSNGIVIYLIS